MLATVWQLVKVHYLHLIGDKTEADIVKWANELVAESGLSIKDMKDKDVLSPCRYLIEICAKIEPRAVNWDIMTDGATEEDAQNNAKYVTSVARKLGAVIFCVWEDIVNVNPKQMLIFIATMNEIQIEMKK